MPITQRKVRSKYKIYKKKYVSSILVECVTVKTNIYLLAKKIISYNNTNQKNTIHEK